MKQPLPLEFLAWAGETAETADPIGWGRAQENRSRLGWVERYPYQWAEMAEEEKEAVRAGLRRLLSPGAPREARMVAIHVLRRMGEPEVARAEGEIWTLLEEGKRWGEGVDFLQALELLSPRAKEIVPRLLSLATRWSQSEEMGGLTLAGEALGAIQGLLGGADVETQEEFLRSITERGELWLPWEVAEFARMRFAYSDPRFRERLLVALERRDVAPEMVASHAPDAAFLWFLSQALRPEVQRVFLKKGRERTHLVWSREALARLAASEEAEVRLFAIRQAGSLQPEVAAPRNRTQDLRA